MLNYLKHYKKLIVLVVLILLFITGNIMDFSAPWLFVVIPAVLVMILSVYEWLLSRENRAEVAYWDIKEFQEHQKLSIDTLDDIFRDERSSGDFSLKTQLGGSLKGSHQMHSPLNQTLCYGYKLTVGLLKAKDFLQKRPSYTRLLINELTTSRLTLHQDNDSILIEGEPLLNLKNSSSQAVSWNGLSRLNEKIVHKINDALTVQNITRNQYTGVLITEELLVPDIDYTIFGICRKRGNKCVIEGNNIVDNPESLYITSFTPSERKLYLDQMRKRVRLRKAFIFPLIMLLLAGPGYFFYDALFRAKGELYYQKSGLAYRLNMRIGSSDFLWEFNESDTADSILLTDKNDAAVYADTNADIGISRQLKETKVFTVGVDPLVSWKDVFWLLDFMNELPTPIPPGNSSQSSRIYIKNTTERDLTIAFIQQAGAVTPDLTWSWEPGYGTEWEYGSYAYHTQMQGADKIESDLLLAPRDIIIVSEKHKILRNYVIGFSGEIRYIDGTGWYLLLDEKSIGLKSGKLFVKNSSVNDYQIYILDPAGKLKYDDYWDFPAGKAADTENGLFLTYKADNDNTLDILLNEGIQLKIIRTAYLPVWKGKLGKCPHARFNRGKKIWEIIIE